MRYHPERTSKRGGQLRTSAVDRLRRRSIGRIIVGALALALASASSSPAQTSPRPQPPGRIGDIPLVLAEHGDPTPAIPLSLTVAGLAIYDIVTAPASARSHNQRNSMEQRSPSTAFNLSLASTGVPVIAGTLAASGASPEAAVLLISVGTVLGPSVGHWYAGRFRRGLTTAALRLGLTVLAGLTLIAAS